MRIEKLEINYDLAFFPEIISEFVETSTRFISEVFIEKDGNDYDGRSIISLLSIGITKGDNIIIKTDGKDEDDLMEELIIVLDR